MKKYLIIGTFLLCLFCGVNLRCYAQNFDAVYNGDSIEYNLETAKWSFVKAQKVDVTDEGNALEAPVVDENSMIFTKKILSGGGPYAAFAKKVSGGGSCVAYFKDGKPVALLRSNYEYIKDGRLFGVDNNKLKYYEVTIKNGLMREKPLNETELQELFPNVEIVPISDFINDEYSTEKKAFRKKRILLFNDTDRTFSKYSYKPPRVQSTELKGLIISPKRQKIIFSHYGDKDGAIEINIK